MSTPLHDTVELIAAASTAYFVDVSPSEASGHVAQILRLTLRTRPGTEVAITVTGPGITPCELTDDRRQRRRVVDVPIEFDAPRPAAGRRVDLDVSVSTAVSSNTTTVSMLVHEPGRTIHLVPHFHMDPVWWNTQSATFDELTRYDWSGSPRMQFQRSVLDILLTHIDRAEDDPAYRFCVAEVDYLGPLWTHHLDARARLQRLIDAGRVEVVGATYNEPNGTLTSAELTRRNLEYGNEFQRGVLGQRADTSWQLDVFGHDPQFPSLLAAAGVETSVWARGPFGAWGPMLEGGFSTPASPGGLQFPTEFEWIAPDGRSVDAAYLAAHYSSGYRIDGFDTIEEAAEFVLDVGTHLGDLAATSHTQFLVGTDLSPPARWITDLPDWFEKRYAWPKVRCSLPNDFLAAMRSELGGRRLSPQSRDMNPVYTGKDVSYIDTKQAQRNIESALVDAELWSTVVRSRFGDEFPVDEIDEAWRHLVYGAHHDAITGTESDQAYLELLAGWRRAHSIAHRVKRRALERLGADVDSTSAARTELLVTVFDSTLGSRVDTVLVILEPSQFDALAVEPGVSGIAVFDHDGTELPIVADSIDVDDQTGSLSSIALRVLLATTGVGRRTLRIVASPGRALPTWSESTGTNIENEHHRLTVDPERGGCVTSWLALGAEEMLVPGGLGNEFVVHDEYPNHPTHGEGPWHLSPTGTVRRSSERPAVVRRETSPIGERLVIDAVVPTNAAVADESDSRVRSTLTLLAGVDRVDVHAVIDEPDLQNELIRVEWAAAVPGATPVVEVGEAVIGRGFAFTEVDAALHPSTLDTAATNWFASSVTACVVLVEHRGDEPVPASSTTVSHAFGVGEVVVPDWSDPAMQHARRLVIALATSGVTATTTAAATKRYGRLEFDSNAPDVRIAVGVIGTNPVAEAALDRLPASGRERIDERLRSVGSARAWTPAARPLTEVWHPGLDVTSDDALPVLTIVAVDDDALQRELDALVDELAGHRIVVETDSATAAADGFRDRWAARTVAVVNCGTPSCAVTTDGVLSSAIMRSSTGWPSGQWIDPPRRTVPDGSSFQLQHWTHEYKGALFARSGDWRDADLVRAANDLQHPLDAVVQIAPLAATASEPVLDVEVSGGQSVPIVRSMRAVRPATIQARIGGARGEAERHRLSVANGRAATSLDVTLTPFSVDEVEFPLPEPVDAYNATPIAHDDPQPVFSRWWSQGRGPLQRLDAPAALRLHPRGRTDGRTIDIDLIRLPDELVSARSQPLDATSLDVEIEVWASDRIVATAFETLEPTTGRTLSFPPDLFDDGAVDELRAVARGTRADGSRWAVYDEVHRSRRAPVVLASDPAAVRVAGGQTVSADISVENRSGLSTWVELDVLCPWGTWTMVEPRHRVMVPPHTTETATITFTAPIDVEPGVWWWGVRMVSGPTVAHSPTADLEVLRPT